MFLGKELVVKCPQCKWELLQCDNCMALIKGINSSGNEKQNNNNIHKDKNKTRKKTTDTNKSNTTNNNNDNDKDNNNKNTKSEDLEEVDYIICRECGFINIILTNIRTRLKLKPLSPLHPANIVCFFLNILLFIYLLFYFLYCFCIIFVLFIILYLIFFVIY